MESRWLFVVVATLMLAACATTRARRPLATTDIEARFRLGHVGGVTDSEPDPGARAAALARFARKIGARDTAVQAAHVALAQARVRHTLAPLAKAQPDDRHLERAVELAIDVGKWAEDPGLIVEAAMLSPRPRRHRRAFIWAAEQIDYLPPRVDVKRAWDRAGSHVGARLGLYRARLPYRAHLPYAGRRPESHPIELTPDELEDAGPAALDIMRAALAEAAYDDDRDRVFTLAAAIRRIDPTEPSAAVLEVVARELSFGRIDLDTQLLRDIVGPGLADSTVSRMRLRHDARPKSVSITLARAVALLHARLFGDAHQVISELQSRNPRVRRVADLLAALARAQAGEIGPALSIRAKLGRSEAITLDTALAELDRKGVDPSLRREAANARRRLFTFDGPRYPGDLALATAADPSASRRQRSRARRALFEHSRALATSCRELELPQDVCSQLQYSPMMFGGSVGSEAVGELTVLAPAHSFDPRWLDETAYADAATLQALQPALERMRGHPVEASPQYQTAALRLAIARGDVQRARALLSRVGPILEIGVVLEAELAVIDLTAGVPAAEISDVYLPPLGREAVFHVQPEDPKSPSASARASAGLALLYAGRHAEAYNWLAPLAKQLDGPAGAELAARAAWAAIRAGDPQAAQAMIARLETLAPDCAALDLVRAEAARTSGKIAAARALYARALERDPSLGAAFSGLLATLDEPGRRHAFALLEHVAPGPTEIARDVVAAHRRGELDDPGQAIEVVAASEDTDFRAAWALGPVGERFAVTSRRAGLWLLERVDEASSPVQAIAAAGEALRYIQRAPDPLAWQEEPINLMMLTGRSEAALAFAAKHGHDLGLEPSDSTMLLVQARRRGSLDDALALAAWRWLRTGDSSAVMTSIIEAPPAGSPELQAFACQELVDRESLATAEPLCRAAWRAKAGGLGVAVNLSYIYATAANPERDAAAARLFEGPRQPPQFPAPAGFDSPRTAGALHHNRSAWLARAGRFRESARASLHASAFGARSSADVPAQELPLRGAAARLVASRPTAEPSAATLGQLARLAAIGGDLAAARSYAAATERLHQAADAEADEGRLVAAWARAAVELVEFDRATKQIRPEDLPPATELLFALDQIEPREKLRERNPRSAVVLTGLVNAYIRASEYAKARPLARTLVQHLGSNPLVLAHALPALVHEGEVARARGLFVAAARRDPGNRLLATARLPESVTGPKPGVPSWARSAAAFDVRLGAVSDAELEGLFPTRRAHMPTGADVLLPAGFAPRASNSLATADGAKGWFDVRFTPRAARCQAAACAASLVEELNDLGMTILWQRQARMPAGVATEMIAVDDERTVWSAVLPAGGRVFRLSASVLHARADQSAPAIRLIRDSFRPLDRTLPVLQAAALRAAGATVSASAVLRARAELAAWKPKRKSCPIAKTLAGAEPPARAELMLDALLVASTPARRRALTRCAPAHSRAARRIALAALLDDDAVVHEYGRDAVAAHPTRVLADTRELLSSPLGTPSSAADALTRPDLPPHGIVEVLLALPIDAARTLAKRLLASADRRDRTLVWLSAAMREGLLSDRERRAAVRTAPVEEARIAARTLGEDPGDLAATRHRLDAMTTVAGAAELDLMGSLSYNLATALQPEDRKRLSSLADKVKGRKDLAKRARARLKDLARDHRRALQLAHDASKAKSKDARAMEWLRASKQRRTQTEPRSTQALRNRPLAELLPGDSWTFARVANPGLFASTVTDLVGRLETGAAAETFLVERILERVMETSGFAALVQGGGLDLTRPIECASPSGTNAFVCSATVTDAGALLTGFGRRPLGSDAGVAIPLHLATSAGAVPVALSATPALLHALVYRGEAELDPAASATVIASERLRAEEDLAGHELDYYGIVRATDKGIVLDSERYLRIGDRVFVFASLEVARRVLYESSEPALAKQPAFKKLTAKWKLGGALQATASGQASPLSDSAVAMEVVVDGRGLAFRYEGTTDAEVSDVDVASAMLPGNAVTTLAFGMGALDDEEEILDDPKGLKASDVMPPVHVVAGASNLAFGWYPRPGDSVWQRWAMVVRQDPAVRRAARRAGLGGAAAAVRRKGRLHYAQRDGYLVVASNAGLVSQALAAKRSSAPGSPGDAAVTLARGRFDGPRAAAVLRKLPAPEWLDPGVLRFAAVALQAAGDVAFDATWNRTTRVGALDGHVHLTLKPADEGTNVVDQWLAAKEARNAGKLPRKLGAKEVEGRLVYTLRVADAKAFVADSIAKSPRIKADVVDSTHVRLTVTAAPRAAGPEPLSKAERKRLLKPAFSSDHTRIIKLSRSLSPAGTPPKQAAAKILDWVHKRIRYEVTPRSMGGVEILDAGRGDCTEYARLTVSLLRAAGVPAEVRDGMAAAGDELVAHAWVGYHDGEAWHEIDPTWGRGSVTAGHLEMSVLDALALLSLGRFEILEIRAGK